jgi:hypothetical protein
MFRFIATLCLVAAPTLAVIHAEDQPEVKEFVSKDGKYKATFPGKVETKESTAKEGGATIYNATALPKPGKLFSVVYFDLPVEIPADKVKETLPMFLAGIKGKSLSDKEVTIGKDKLPGREAVYEMKGAHIRMLILLDGKRVYQVMVGGPTKEDVATKEADSFIKSFEITK